MRVLHVITALDPGGAATQLADLLRHTRHRAEHPLLGVQPLVTWRCHHCSFQVGEVRVVGLRARAYRG